MWHTYSAYRRKEKEHDVRRQREAAGCVNGQLRLLPHPNFDPGAGDPRQPQFVVEYQPRRDGDFYEVGAAWIKKLRQSDGEFLSITIDAPTFDKPLNLAAFPPDEKGQPWRLQWSRPRAADDQLQG
jgi:uncharacterized protein (DUF736 family)